MARWLHEFRFAERRVRPVYQTASPSRMLLVRDQIVIGGDFQGIDGVLRGYVARLEWNGSVDMQFNTAVGANLPVATVGEGEWHDYGRWTIYRVQR